MTRRAGDCATSVENGLVSLTGSASTTINVAVASAGLLALSVMAAQKKDGRFRQ